MASILLRNYSKRSRRCAAVEQDGCDEQLDQRILGYFNAFDFDGLASVDDRSYQSGTSEVKLHVPILAAMAELGFKMNLVDYVSCYRTGWNGRRNAVYVLAFARCCLARDRSCGVYCLVVMRLIPSTWRIQCAGK